MDYAINDREPSITKIKILLADLQQKINAYKTQINTIYNIAAANASISKNATKNVMVYGNNGWVSCNQYCHGNYGKSWNNELPVEWIGAQCTAAGANKEYPCTYSNRGTSPLQCTCQRNDSFPYSRAGSGDNSVPSPLFTFSSLESGGAAALNRMRDAILTQISTINTEINLLLPIATDNKTKTDASVMKFLNKFNEMNIQFNKYEDELKNPGQLLEANYEMTRINTTANFRHYIVILICMIFIVGCLIYISKNPEAGNLDLFILALAVIILVYYIYQFIVSKMRQ